MTVGVFGRRSYPSRNSDSVTTFSIDTNDGASVYPHGCLTVHAAHHPSWPAPLPHYMVALSPLVAMVAYHRLSGPPTQPTAPTCPQTTMKEMDGFSPIPPSLVDKTTSSSSNRLHPARIRLSATVDAATGSMGGVINGQITLFPPQLH